MITPILLGVSLLASGGAAPAGLAPDASFADLIASPAAWISLLTLAALEIVLGIDNIVFIAILAGKLPKEKQLKARRLGLALALISRLALLLSLTWVMGLTSDLFHVPWFSGDVGISGRDLILLCGGLFLVAKATFEIYDKVEAEHDEHGLVVGAAAVSMGWILFQIMLPDIVFSLDSVITAVGMAQHLSIMITAVIVAIAVMLIFAGPIGDFVEQHPSIKLLALSFLVMIGVLLTAEAFDQHIPKGYVYFGMGFSLLIEVLNMRYRKRQARLRKAQSVLHKGPHSNAALEETSDDPPPPVPADAASS